MRFYTRKPEDPTAYIWETDRFMFFTESEKCSILEGLKYHRDLWNHIEEARVSGGLVEMVDRMIKELEDSL